ncbi:MAG: endolytic transglycosylase MltG [Spirochaetales bacterium]|nr:endolytic transglycosylase MltG [Spirochaetales bacterium]
MRKIFKILLSLGTILIIIGVSAFILSVYLNSPSGEKGSESIIFRIDPGESLKSIASDLTDIGLIRYPWPLYLYSRLVGSETDFKVGIYNISPNLSLLNIHDLLVSGKQKLYRITIPEGWTSRQIAVLLEKEGITDSQGFLESVETSDLRKKYNIPGANLEGFLYPDTYLFQKNFPPEKVVEVMVENFFERLEEIYPAYEDIPKDNLYDKIVLASIVEREYRDPNEAPLMAGVFYNRLSNENPIPLGSCATIVYIISDIQKKPHPSIITYDDLEISSPYNTYRNTGLPPGPISNPGRIALEASFFPEDSDYLYFLLKNPESGQHEFTKTLSEHTSAYNLYIKND